MGVYGSFLTAFPELFVTIELIRPRAMTIRAIFLPHGGDAIVRRKITSGNWVGEIATDDLLFVPIRYKDAVAVGTIFRYNNDEYRLMGVKDFMRLGDFVIYVTERVQGAAHDQDAELKIKRGTFS